MKLTPEQEAYLKKLADPRYYGEQDENGVDLSLIRNNLAMSVEDRIAQASRARRSALRTLEIGRKNRERQSHLEQRT